VAGYAYANEKGLISLFCHSPDRINRRKER
jgi:hypothetical protein